ncbi:MAG: hydrolase [Deltaproteobacteria bacterium]|nr:hydrolase [Deltaproteobacteria bacterium]
MKTQLGLLLVVVAVISCGADNTAGPGDSPGSSTGPGPREPVDAGAPELPDSGSPITPADAGPSAQADAGTPTASDAGSPIDGGTTRDAGATLDAGPGPVSCGRSPDTKRAPFSLLAPLKAAVAAASDAPSREAHVTTFINDVKTRGGTPLIDDASDRVAFIYRGRAGRTYSVAGAWTNWTPTLAMQRLGATDLWFVETTLTRSAPHEYKIVDDTSAWLEDRLAQNVAWDGMNHYTVGEFNAVARPENWDAAKGRLVAWRGFPSTTLSNARDVYIYVPATYDNAACPSLPSLYFHDGNESLTRSPFAASADTAYASNPASSAVLVFVALPNQNVRMAEYTFGTTGAKGDAYGTFLKDELRPAIEARFRVCRDPSDRGLAGASLGGLIAAYLAFQSPTVWGYVGSQSGSFFWADDALITRAGEDPKVGVRFYLDHGCPGDNCAENRDINTKLVGKGYEVKHIEESGAQHDWAYWQRRLPGLLNYFREGRTGCR